MIRFIKIKHHTILKYNIYLKFNNYKRQKMKKILSIILSLLILTLTSSTYAISISWSNITINENSKKSYITVWEVFNFFGNYYTEQIPESYKYININFKNIEKWSTLEESLQKLVYLDLIENTNRDLFKNRELNAWGFFRLSEKILWIKINDAESKEDLLNRNTNQNDINTVSNFIWKNKVTINSKTTSKEIKQKIAIMQDIYNTIIKWHYNKDNFDEWEIIDSAISWITKWTDDKHTVYFPPIESENFNDALNWDYEWIWSYVDMEKPGAVRIVSPIPWSPSEKAWLKWWDLIIKVDWKEIKEDNSLKEVITWIKWPAWSHVLLTINRNWAILEIEVIRERIILTDIESEILNTTTYYLQIKSFWEHVSRDFKESIKVLNENKNINKIIIDLRNNWWGYLNEVTEMLSYFVEKDQNTAVVKYHDSEKIFISKWYELVDFSKYKIVILQNSGTASASEILIWTLKDYYENIELIWENTYWKWSVQVMKSYTDWSLLKYTIAKWFTWWTETWIDWIWIKPTIELEFDLKNYKRNWFDNQLDKAIFIN